MTLMIILGAAAALYLARLLHRLTIFALPIGTGPLVAVFLNNDGRSWLAAAACGVLVGVAVYGAGRALVAGRFPAPVRFLVLLLFSAAAACAGYEAGLALAALGGVDTTWRTALALLLSLFSATASWCDMLAQTSAKLPRPAD